MSMTMRWMLALCLLTASSCTPRLAGDGTYGCANGLCPASMYCHANQRCYTTPETDSGPPRDAFSVGIDRYGLCPAGSGCRAGLECRMGRNGRVCMQPCESSPDDCTDGTACGNGPGSGMIVGRDCYLPCSRCMEVDGECGGPDMGSCIPDLWRK